MASFACCSRIQPFGVTSAAKCLLAHFAVFSMYTIYQENVNPKYNDIERNLAAVVAGRLAATGSTAEQKLIYLKLRSTVRDEGFARYASNSARRRK